MNLPGYWAARFAQIGGAWNRRVAVAAPDAVNFRQKSDPWPPLMMGAVRPFGGLPPFWLVWIAAQGRTPVVDAHWFRECGYSWQAIGIVAIRYPLPVTLTIIKSLRSRDSVHKVAKRRIFLATSSANRNLSYMIARHSTCSWSRVMCDLEMEKVFDAV